MSKKTKTVFFNIKNKIMAKTVFKHFRQYTNFCCFNPNKLCLKYNLKGCACEGKAHYPSQLSNNQSFCMISFYQLSANQSRRGRRGGVLFPRMHTFTVQFFCPRAVFLILFHCFLIERHIL